MGFRNQNERVLDYMKQNGSITTLEAFENLAVTRLSARIADLRADGHIIASKRESGLNRFGDKVNYVRYVLH